MHVCQKWKLKKVEFHDENCEKYCTHRRRDSFLELGGIESPRTAESLGISFNTLEVIRT